MSQIVFRRKQRQGRKIFLRHPSQFFKGKSVLQQELPYSRPHQKRHGSRYPYRPTQISTKASDIGALRAVHIQKQRPAVSVLRQKVKTIYRHLTGRNSYFFIGAHQISRPLAVNLYGRIDWRHLRDFPGKSFHPSQNFFGSGKIPAFGGSD